MIDLTDPNIQDKDGNTVLHKILADKASNTRSDFVRALLNSKINLELKNKDGKTATELLDDSNPKDADLKKLFEKSAPMSVIKIVAGKKKNTKGGGQIFFRVAID